MKRRTFLTATAGIAATAAVPKFAIGRPGKSPNSKLNIAFIGSGGWIAQQPYQQRCSEENLVAFCDVDRNHCAENMKNWQTNQPFFDDFRVMFDKMHKEIDAVVVSTPDHTHFAATMATIERGIHVYTQKPLTHNIWQCRTLVKAKGQGQSRDRTSTTRQDSRRSFFSVCWPSDLIPALNGTPRRDASPINRN